MGVRKKAIIALVALLVVAIVACGVRAATDARHAEGSTLQPAVEEGAASQQAASEGAPRIAVEGPDGDAAAVLGGEQAADALDREVAAWCEANVEGATSARWKGKITCDFRAGTFRLAYQCDDGAATSVRVVARPAEGKYEISKAAS